MGRRTKSTNTFCMFVCLVCFVTNISQMPYLVESSLTRYVSIPVWIVLAGICAIMHHFIYLHNIRGILTIFTLFVVYLLIASILNGNFWNSALPYPMALSMFVLMIGTMAGRFLNLDDVKKICTAYALSGVIVCINVFFTYIYGNSLMGSTYLYASKNSISQILLTTWAVILLLKFNGRGGWKKAFYIACFAMLTWTMIGLKSRATLIGIPVAVIWIIWHGKLNKRTRNIVLLLLIAFILLMMNDSIFDFFINQIVYGGRKASSLYALSSGRSEEWTNFLSDWQPNWLLGQGRMKRESLVLTALLEFGLLGGSLILVLAVYPFFWGIRNLSREHPYFLLFTVLALIYIVNGIFEQLAPFGPGVKCYFLWFMMGLLCTIRKNEY